MDQPACVSNAHACLQYASGCSWNPRKSARGHVGNWLNSGPLMSDPVSNPDQGPFRGRVWRCKGRECVGFTITFASIVFAPPAYFDFFELVVHLVLGGFAGHGEESGVSQFLHTQVLPASGPEATIQAQRQYKLKVSW